MEGKIPAKEERVHDGQSQSNVAQTRLKEEERETFIQKAVIVLLGWMCWFAC